MSTLAKIELGSNATDFINDQALEDLLKRPAPDTTRIGDILDKSLDKQPLTLEETADLLLVTDPEQLVRIFEAAGQLKHQVYGKRIVLFAPLYIGSHCVNNCPYCGFKSTNRDALRRTLTEDEIQEQIRALQNMGHKRLILVYGEHPKYDADYIAHTIQTVYDTEGPIGDIRRVNINAAPLDIDGFRKVADAGIGVYQIFQETYHHAIYEKLHDPRTRKGNYLWRLDGLSRAMEAGIGDVGIGALFGLYDWRFEVLGLISHALHLQQRFGAGPHTISFPRLKPAAGVQCDDKYLVSDDEFKRLIAILRLAAPYAGMVCTAREPAEVRREALKVGVTQIDAGTRIEMGGYTEAGDTQVMEREQFQIGDIRSLDEVVRELIQLGHIPSFCTACYRIGRTGSEFMEYSIPGFIQDFCLPNAMSTLQEYLIDHASPETRDAGEAFMKQETESLGKMQKSTLEKLHRIREMGERDLYV